MWIASGEWILGRNSKSIRFASPYVVEYGPC